MNLLDRSLATKKPPTMKCNEKYTAAQHLLAVFQQRFMPDVLDVQICTLSALFSRLSIDGNNIEDDTDEQQPTKCVSMASDDKLIETVVDEQQLSVVDNEIEADTYGQQPPKCVSMESDGKITEAGADVHRPTKFVSFALGDSKIDVGDVDRVSLSAMGKSIHSLPRKPLEKTTHFMTNLRFENLIE